MSSDASHEGIGTQGKPSPYALCVQLLCGFCVASLCLPRGWLPRVRLQGCSLFQQLLVSGDLLVRTAASQLSRLEKLGSPFSPLALLVLPLCVDPFGCPRCVYPSGVLFALTRCAELVGGSSIHEWFIAPLACSVSPALLCRALLESSLDTAHAYTHDLLKLDCITQIIVVFWPQAVHPRI